MDPVQNLSIKIKKYSWTCSMTGGPWNRSKVGVHGPLVHVLSFGSKAITGSSFKFKLSHRSFAYWQTDLCEFGENFGGRSAIQRVHEWRPAKNFPPNSQKWNEPQLAGESLIWSLRHVKSINAMGEWCYGFDLSMLMLILQHSVWSWSLWCFYMLFNCYFKECFNAKGRTKNRDIDFLRLFSLGFQRSCIKTD